MTSIIGAKPQSARSLDGTRLFVVPAGATMQQVLAEMSAPNPLMATICAYDADFGLGAWNPALGHAIAITIEHGTIGGINQVAGIPLERGWIMSLPGSHFRVIATVTGGMVAFQRRIGAHIATGPSTPLPPFAMVGAVENIAGGGVLGTNNRIPEYAREVRVCSDNAPFNLVFLPVAGGAPTWEMPIGGNDSGWVGIPPNCFALAVRNTGAFNINVLQYSR